MFSGTLDDASADSDPQHPGCAGSFHRFLEALPAAAYTCDAEGRITCYNEHARELWGRAPSLNDPGERFCGAFRLFAPDGSPLPRQRCWMALALQGGKAFNSRELLIERPDGSRVGVLANASPLLDGAGRVCGGVNILIDISHRRRAEEAVRAAQAERESQLNDLTLLNEMSARLSATLELQPILDAVLQTACAIDRTPMGLLALADTDAGPLHAAASRGLPPDVVRQLAVVPAAAGACGRALAQRARMVAEDVDTAPCFEPFRAVARQAGFRSVHSTPLITRAGRIVGVLSTHAPHVRRPSPWQMHLLDLCARQAADFIENARLYAQVNEQQRRKDEFLAVLAHELRNPLAPIQNAAQVLQAPRVEDDHRLWAASTVDRQVRHMARLVDDLLDLQRISHGRLELRRAPIDVADVVHAAVESSRPLIDSRGQALHLDLTSEPIHVDGDLTRLAQALADLLDNAAKFTPPGGAITVQTRRVDGQVLIRVRDTGIGIAADQLATIFQEFGRPQPPAAYAYGCIGVGLTLAKRLVELHHGALSAMSEGINRGSEFTVHLPLREPPAAAPVRPAVAAPAGLRIVVVDDNRDSATSLALMLRLMGNDVRTGHDGREAVALAEAFRPDAVLLDIGLPVLSGYEAARQIRAGAAGRCVLVAITGWGQESDLARSREAGFDHHLVKPADIARLLEILESARSAGAPTHQPPALAAKRRHAREGGKTGRRRGHRPPPRPGASAAGELS
jgi:signal transduction histidine kinase/DNA-binding NarL/FixJ family response regulator